jgi:hypothetical protein
MARVKERGAKKVDSVFARVDSVCNSGKFGVQLG